MVEKRIPATVDKAYALLIDPKWLEARCLALGSSRRAARPRNHLAWWCR
ncbi:MAG: hypothetical protein IPK42_00315 [Betaproteobacteria bacterium]|nr:hypothetical protein [Betaproteobacteria bacterium]